MNGAPWFKFFPAAFMESVAEFMPEERGAYISLLCHQWHAGDLPGDRMRMERLAGGPVSDAVAGKFVPAATPGRVFNVRLEASREEAQRRSIAGTAAVEKRWANRNTKPDETGYDRITEQDTTVLPSNIQRLEVRGKRIEDRGEREELTPQPPNWGSAEKVVDDPDAGYPEDFLAFWKAFPAIRKKNKGQALRRWKEARKKRSAEFILQSVEDHKAFCADWLRGDGKFIPGPEVWLNKGSYDATFDRTKPFIEDDGRPY